MLGTMMTKSTHCNVDTREHLLATGETSACAWALPAWG